MKKNVHLLLVWVAALFLVCFALLSPLIFIAAYPQGIDGYWEEEISAFDYGMIQTDIAEYPELGIMYLELSGDGKITRREYSQISARFKELEKADDQSKENRKRSVAKDAILLEIIKVRGGDRDE